MKFEITVNIGGSKLDEILDLLRQINERTKTMPMTLDDIRSRVQNETTVIEGVKTLLASLAQQLKDALAAGDQAKIAEIAAAMDANTQSLSDAVVANTTPAPTA